MMKTFVKVSTLKKGDLFSWSPGIQAFSVKIPENRCRGKLGIFHEEVIFLFSHIETNAHEDMYVFFLNGEYELWSAHISEDEEVIKHNDSV